jgi:DnaK suppressor protein
MTKRSEINLAALEARLKARREELLHLEEVSEESRRPVELDQSRVGRLSRMDALQDQAMSLETERRRRLELQRIDAALARMAESDYGFCVHCGEAIAARRLALDPAVPICVDCAQG